MRICVFGFKLAKSVDAKVIGVVGRDGGYTKQVSDVCVVVPTVNAATVTPHTEAFQAVADQMDDTGPHNGAREHGSDSVRKVLQAVEDGEDDIVHAAGLELVHDAPPELGGFGLFNPDTQNMLLAFAIERQGEVDGLVLDHALVADLHPQSVEENHWVDRVERPVPPLAHLVEDGVSDPAEEVGRDIDGIELAQVALDLAHRHAAGGPAANRCAGWRATAVTASRCGPRPLFRAGPG